MVHGPGPNGQCASCWYGRLCVQKLTLSEFDDVKAELGIFETNVRIQWNPVYKVFHRIRCCGNETIVSSNSNVILTRQTCSQRSGMAAVRNRRAIAFYFPVRICYMFPMMKCRGKSELGLCMTSVIAKRMPLLSADFRRILRLNTLKNRKSALRSRFSLEVPKSCTDLDPTLLYISKLGRYSKFVRKDKMLALGVCLPQPCPSAGRRFAASRSRLNRYYQFFRFYNNKFDEIPCKLDSTEYARSLRKYPTLP